MPILSLNCWTEAVLPQSPELLGQVQATVPSLHTKNFIDGFYAFKLWKNDFSHFYLFYFCKQYNMYFFQKSESLST